MMGSEDTGGGGMFSMMCAGVCGAGDSDEGPASDSADKCSSADPSVPSETGSVSGAGAGDEGARTGTEADAEGTIFRDKGGTGADEAVDFVVAKFGKALAFLLGDV